MQQSPSNLTLPPLGLTCEGCSFAKSSPTKNPPPMRKRSSLLSVQEASRGLEQLQTYIGVALLLSAFAGVILLVSDRALWILAPSHGVGLLGMVIVDGLLGSLSLAAVRAAYLPSLAAALIGVMLQFGDIVTAAQFGMTVSYFASYLLGLWAFDFLLASQLAVLILHLRDRQYSHRLGGTRTRGKRELNYSRRSFLTGMAGVGLFLIVDVLIGTSLLNPPSQNSTNTQPGLPSGAIANTKNLQPNSPVYFEYPSGSPNMLVKKADGTLVALSMLCTHVCCQCYYDPTSALIACPCHGSLFNLDGQVLQGPAAYPLPPITLNVDADGNVFPTRINGYSPCLQG